MIDVPVAFAHPATIRSQSRRMMAAVEQTVPEDSMDRYILSYVNLPERDINLDMEFNTIIQLMAFVNTSFPTVTSYQIVVVRKVET